MALTSKYQQFLLRPSADALAPGAAINYLPSLTTITEPAAIIKHFGAQAQQVKKKENILHAIDGDNSICVEAETTLNFVSGGGTYLPGLDDNFLADKTVTIPVVHIVNFNDSQKIQQIRLTWDQGSLLKCIDVIGARGKNWPLFDGKDTIKQIATSIDSAISSSAGTTSKADTERRGRRQSRGGANADKHSSLELFPQREAEREESPASSIAQRATTAKPPPRDYHDLFAGGANLPKDRDPSPSKGNPLKAGAGKHYHENRLFDSTPVDLTGAGSPEKVSIKTNPKKYNHFEFGEPDKSDARPTSSKQSKNGAQWNFEDFVTPQKTRERKLPHHERNFGWSDDEEEAKKPPVHRAHVPQARPDSKPHFDFNDETTPTQGKPRPGARVQNEQQRGLYEDHIMQASGEVHNHGEKGSAAVSGPTASEKMQQSKARPGARVQNEQQRGLYEDHIMQASGEVHNHGENSIAATSGPGASEKMPLGNITNVNNKGHNKMFGSQFDMTDASPTASGKSENVTENRKKATNTMSAHWEMYDESPKDREVKPRGINIQGDGMGARKKPGEKSWWEYDE